MKALFQPISIDMTDLTNPSSTAQYPVGASYEVVDEFGNVSVYTYAKAHAALTAYQPYVINYSATNGVVSAAPVTLAANINEVIVPQTAVTSGYFFFGLTSGYGSALVPALAAGRFLELANAATAFADDGASLTANSAAQLLATTVAPGVGTVRLLGLQVQVA